MSLYNYRMLNVSRGTYIIEPGIYTFQEITKNFSRFSKVSVDKIDSCRVVFILPNQRIGDKPVEFGFYYSGNKIHVEKYIVILYCNFTFHYQHVVGRDILKVLNDLYTYANKIAKDSFENAVRNREKK